MGQTTVPTAQSAPDVSPSPTRDVSSFGVIVFLASDIMLFAPFFAAYFLLRSTNHPWPPDVVELYVARAGAATAVLMLSSLTLTMSDRAEHGDRPAAQRRWLLITIALGTAFLANQAAECATMGFGADDHPYGSVYWLLTGLHSTHVTVGVLAMMLLYIRSRLASSTQVVSTWSGGVSMFWHLVDVVWIGVFLTIWVVR
ncbi:heme-copper oxidase subunit III [soil metagenome]